MKVIEYSNKHPFLQSSVQKLGAYFGSLLYYMYMNTCSQYMCTYTYTHTHIHTYTHTSSIAGHENSFSYSQLSELEYHVCQLVLYYHWTGTQQLGTKKMYVCISHSTVLPLPNIPSPPPPPPVLSSIAFVHSHFIDCLCPLASSVSLRPLTLHRFLSVHSRFIGFSPSTHASSVSLRPLTLHRFPSVHSRFIGFPPSTHASSVSLRPLTLHRFLSVHSRFIGFPPSTHASSVSLRPLTLHRFPSVHSRFIGFLPSTHA